MKIRTEKPQRGIRIFGLASFFNDLGSDMIYPVWPLFITVTLKANMSALGFLDGLGEALVSLSQALSGYLSDRWRKRKIFIWTGYLCGVLSRLGYAVSAVWTQVLPFRVLDRAGKVRSAPRDAMVADLSTDRNRGRNFGLMRAMDHAGAAAGILACIVLVNFINLRLLFALAAVPSLISVFLIVVLIKDRTPSGPDKIFKGLSLKSLPPDFRTYLAASGFFALGAFSYSFLLIFAREAGFKAGFVPVLYLLYTAAASIFSIPFGRLSDRLGRKKVLYFSFVLWAAVCLGMILVRSLILMTVLFIFYGLHKAALEPVQRTWVCEMAPAELRASFLGAYQMTIGLCALPASLLAGILWDRFGRIVPFVLSLALTGLAALALAFVKEMRCHDSMSPHQ
ncbi:MAG: MFS transporter [Candidatus Aminicenantes bacterium]|nr:MFS transporter [Candidatus Aminicenantes bacterium]